MLRERLLAVAGVVFAVSTLLSAFIGLEWIEELTGFEPDGGSGTLEVAMIAGSALVSIACLVAAFRLRQRRQA